MYEFVTEWLPKDKENIIFVQKEAFRIAKENNVGIIKDDKSVALVKEIRMNDIIKRKHIKEVLTEKFFENREINEALKTKKVLWISRLNTTKS